jgi:hypothetical protein
VRRHHPTGASPASSLRRRTEGRAWPAPLYAVPCKRSPGSVAEPSRATPRTRQVARSPARSSTTRRSRCSRRRASSECGVGQASLVRQASRRPGRHRVMSPLGDAPVGVRLAKHPYAAEPATVRSLKPAPLTLDDLLLAGGSVSSQLQALAGRDGWSSECVPGLVWTSRQVTDHLCNSPHVSRRSAAVTRWHCAAGRGCAPLDMSARVAGVRRGHAAGCADGEGA